MKISNFLINALSFILITVLGTFSVNSKPIDIKISHATNISSFKGKTWEYFKNLANKSLGNKINITHNHSAQLYGQSEGIQALQAGAVHFISPGAPLLTGAFPKMAVFGLPLMYDPPEEIREIAASPEIGGKIFAEMPAKNLKFLAFWFNGYRNVGSTKGPILSIEDLSKVKIRTPGGKIYRDTFKALDGNPVGVAWKEIHTALQQGLVDAIEPTMNAWQSQKLYELAPDITYTKHILSVYIVATNAKWWDGLSSDVRSKLKSAIDKTTEWNWREGKKASIDAVSAMTKAGTKFHHLSPKETKRWFNKVKSVHKQYEKVIGKDILDAVYKIVE
jgi:C4-dicarboxylate-binding protein DctP